MSLNSPLTVTISWTFFFLFFFYDDLNGFDEFWSGIA